MDRNGNKLKNGRLITWWTDFRSSVETIRASRKDDISDIDSTGGPSIV